MSQVPRPFPFDQLAARWMSWQEHLERAAVQGDKEADSSLEAVDSLNAAVRLQLERPDEVSEECILRFGGGNVRVESTTDAPLAAHMRMTPELAWRVLQDSGEPGGLGPPAPAALLRMLAEPTTVPMLRRQNLVFEVRLRNVPELSEGSVFLSLGDSDPHGTPRFCVVADYRELRSPENRTWDLQRALVEGRLQILGDVGAAMQLALSIM